MVIILSILLLLSIAALSVNIPIYETANALNQNQGITAESPPLVAKSNRNNATTALSTIPIAQSVYASQSITLPTSVRTFVWYIVNEAHEHTDTESYRLISNHNPDYIPTNLIVPEGVGISFLNADAPWDKPHPHTINILDSISKRLVYTTGKLDYTNSTSTPAVLPVGKYNIRESIRSFMKGTLTVIPNPQKIVNNNKNNNNNLIVGGFYTPTNQVANNKDNDGGVHPGWLGYYKAEFPKNGFKILSEHNFHYATCTLKQCVGGFWPDQKTGDHTLLIYSTNQPLSEALSKLSKMVWNNVYI